MKRVLLALSVILLIGCSTVGNLPLITKISGDRREFEIVQVNYLPREGVATIRFPSSFGIFAFDLDPGGRRFKTVTFIVNNQRYCKGLTFQDRSGHAADLLHAKGVQVFSQDTDLVIVIAPPAVDLLKAGGWVQYVNQYR